MVNAARIKLKIEYQIEPTFLIYPRSCRLKNRQQARSGSSVVDHSRLFTRTESFQLFSKQPYRFSRESIQPPQMFVYQYESIKNRLTDFRLKFPPR
uniref:Uncharacterized protein n=1 Tax=Romanomermis culicivorax TaxID=13658 RepID=A0A915IWY4_ROMCU